VFQRNLDEQARKAGEMTLEELLGTARGLSFFMEHCRREFSEENLLCYQDIEMFRRHTNREGFMRLFTKYFAHHAPFPVNLPDSVLSAIRRAEGDLVTMELQQIQVVFNDARKELLRLMETDTYLRFLRTNLFLSYARGEKLQTGEGRNTNTRDNPSNNHPSQEDRFVEGSNEDDLHEETPNDGSGPAHPLAVFISKPSPIRTDLGKISVDVQSSLVEPSEDPSTSGARPEIELGTDTPTGVRATPSPSTASAAKFDSAHSPSVQMEILNIASSERNPVNTVQSPVTPRHSDDAEFYTL